MKRKDELKKGLNYKRDHNIIKFKYYEKLPSINEEHLSEENQNKINRIKTTKDIIVILKKLKTIITEITDILRNMTLDKIKIKK